MEAHLEHVEPLDARQFHVAIKRLADTLSYGTDRSRFLGPGIEYVQSRPYQYGDPVRSIDWRVTARTGRVHVKEYDAPKQMPCYLLIDTSASMTISSSERSKYALALHLAGGIALACLERVSPVGVLAVGESGLRVDPSLSKDRVMQWLLRMRRFRYDERTTLARRLRELCATLRSRALIVALTDLHEEGAVEALELCAQVHDTAVLQIQDRAERGIAGAGLLRAREAETGRLFVTHGRARWVDPDGQRAELRRAAVDHLLVRTDEPYAHRVRHFFASRDLLGGGAR